MTIYKSNNLFERLDLSLLRYFFAVVSFGGFSKASRATGISQPALSLGLQKLEKALGMQLVERKAGTFALTEAGQVLSAFCKKLEGSLDLLLTDLKSDRSTAPRRLRVGTALSVGFGPLLHACLENSKSETPLELELSAQNTFQLLSAVKDGQVDAALVPDDIYDRHLEITPLFKDRLVFVHSPKHRSRAKSVSEFPLITYPRETPMRATIDHFCAKHGLTFRSVTSVNGLDAILGLVRHGAGGAFVLRSLVEEDLKAGTLVEADLPFKLPTSGVVLITSPEEHGRDVAKLLRRLMNASGN